MQEPFLQLCVPITLSKRDSCISDSVKFIRTAFLQNTCKWLEISLTLTDFTGLLKNVRQFIFIICHPPCYLRRELFRVKHYREFSRFSLRAQLHQLEGTKRNVLDLADFRNQVRQRKLVTE